MFSAILNNLVWCLLKSNSLYETERYAKEAFSLESRNNEILNTYSKVLISLAKFIKYEEILCPVVEKSLGDPRHCYSPGICFENTNKIKEAIHQYNRALDSSSNES